MNVLPPTAMLMSVFSGAAVCAAIGAVESATAQTAATIAATILMIILSLPGLRRLIDFGAFTNDAYITTVDLSRDGRFSGSRTSTTRTKVRLTNVSGES